MMKYNKGEWSEAYAFIKLIGDGKVYASDDELNKIEDKIYFILKVFRDEINKYYECNTEKGIVNIVNSNGDLISSIDANYFINISNISLDLIKNSKGRSFKIPILENFLKNIGIVNFKGSSAKKEDIKMEIKDVYLDKEDILTFSIKSELGSKPTLLNASKATNFLYKIEGITKEDVEYLNNLKNTENKWLKLKFNKIFNEYVNGNYNVSLINEKDNIFYQNLRLIDSHLPELISFILLYYYSHEKITSIASLTNKLIDFNPLDLINDEKEMFYKNNIFEFIKAITFGMMPSNKWDGNYEISGGLLTVKNDGDVLCHHLFYDKQSLNNYLYKNTKLETPSTSRHDFGEIFEDNGDFYFKLNLQIRLK